MEFPLSDTFKSKRDEFNIEIRKKKNDQVIKMKRTKLVYASLLNKGENFRDSKSIQVLLLNSPNYQLTEEFESSFRLLQKAIQEKNNSQIAEIANHIRKIFSQTEDAPAALLVSTGIIPTLISLLGQEYHSKPEILVESLWIMTNIASADSNSCFDLVEKGIIPITIQLLSYDDESVKENALWLISNITGDNFQLRDKVLNEGITTAVIEMLAGKVVGEHIVEQASWLISNLCRGKPYPVYQKVYEFLPVLQYLITLENERIFQNTLWALSHLSHGDNNQLHDLFDLDILEQIIKGTQLHQIPQIHAPALRILGNLMTGEDFLTQKVINQGALTAILPFLYHNKEALRKEACWIFSNLLASGVKIIDQVFQLDYKGGSIIDILREKYYNDHVEIAKESFLAITNSTANANAHQLEILINKNMIEMIVDEFKRNKGEIKLLKGSLEALENTLNTVKEELNFEFSKNPVILRLADAGGIEELEKLQKHKNEEISTIVNRIIENHFETEDFASLKTQQKQKNSFLYVRQLNSFL